MALQTSGKISASDINTELTEASNASFSMGNAEERALAGIPSGPISMSDFYGKSSYTPPPDWSNLIQQKILASDAEASDQFGQKVAISSDGQVAAVGAWLEDTGGSGAGAVYIYIRSGDAWTQRQKIQASDPQTQAYFGDSVTVSDDGTYIFVGSSGEDTGGYRAGAVYAYMRSGYQWYFRQKLMASDKQESDRFGRDVSVSADGQQLAIGAHREGTGGYDAGATYMFYGSGSTWTQRDKIQASDKQTNDNFGWSVAMSGDGMTAIVGAYGEDTSGNDAGAAYIFTRSGYSWTQRQKIQASDIQDSDWFGRSVAISGDGTTAIVGAYREDEGGSDAGAAYIFTRSGETWTQQKKILASDIQAGDEFGYSVSISSDGATVIVGALYEDTGGSDAGAAYIFTRSGNTWTQKKKIQASDIQAGDEFGYSVSISSDGTTAIVGAYREDTGGTSAGAAYIFVDQ